MNTRTVGYAPGSSAALTQTFTYVTQWDQQDPVTWDTKTTTVVTTDNVTQQTTKTVYQYSPIYQASQPDSGRAPQLPVEQKITYYDGSGTLLQTVNEQWQDQFLQTQQQTVLPNGITTETDKQLGGSPACPQKKTTILPEPLPASQGKSFTSITSTAFRAKSLQRMGRATRLPRPMCTTTAKPRWGRPRLRCRWRRA